MSSICSSNDLKRSMEKLIDLNNCFFKERKQQFCFVLLATWTRVRKSSTVPILQQFLKAKQFLNETRKSFLSTFSMFAPKLDHLSPCHIVQHLWAHPMCVLCLMTSYSCKNYCLAKFSWNKLFFLSSSKAQAIISNI